MYGETLALDHTFRPLRAVSWRTAITAWLNGRVEILAHYSERLIHHTGLLMPAVVRFLKKTKGRVNQQVRLTRYNVYLRDQGRCQYCDKKLPYEQFQLEHVVPKHKGGATAWHNVVAACRSCNTRKGGQTIEQANMSLLSRPSTPQLLCSEVPPDWEPFL